jgi:hypothetical protein
LKENFMIDRDRDTTFDGMRRGQGGPDPLEGPEQFDEPLASEGDEQPGDYPGGGEPPEWDDDELAGGRRFEQTPLEADEDQRVLGRRDRRIQAQQEAIQQERARAAELERQLNEARRQQDHYNRQQTEFNERQYVESLPWEQRQQYELQRMRENNERQLQQMQFQMGCQNDYNQFASKCLASPGRQRMSQAVEQVFQQQLGAGRFYPREQIYRYLLGEEQEQREVQAQQRAPRRVQQTGVPGQRVRAPNPGSNQQQTRSRGGSRNPSEMSLAERERRLENIKF